MANGTGIRLVMGSYSSSSLASTACYNLSLGAYMVGAVIYEVFMNTHSTGGHAGWRLVYVQFDWLCMAMLSAVCQLSSWLGRSSRFPFVFENIFTLGYCHSHGCYSCDKASPALLVQGLFLGSRLFSLSLICHVSAVNQRWKCFQVLFPGSWFSGWTQNLNPLCFIVMLFYLINSNGLSMYSEYLDLAFSFCFFLLSSNLSTRKTSC